MEEDYLMTVSLLSGPTETILTVAVRCSDAKSLKDTLSKIHTLHFIDDQP